MTKNLFIEGPPKCGKTTLLFEKLGSSLKNAQGFFVARIRCADGRIAGYRIIRAGEGAETADVWAVGEGAETAEIGAVGEGAETAEIEAIGEGADCSVAGSFCTDRKRKGVFAAGVTFIEFTESGSLLRLDELSEFICAALDENNISAKVCSAKEFASSEGCGVPAAEVTSDGKAKYILMDEIGGAELLNESVRNSVINALHSDIPVIGVLKSTENAKKAEAAELAGRVASVGGSAYLRIYGEFRRKLKNDNNTTLVEYNAFSRSEIGQLIEDWMEKNHVGNIRQID